MASPNPAAMVAGSATSAPGPTSRRGPAGRRGPGRHTSRQTAAPVSAAAWARTTVRAARTMLTGRGRPCPTGLLDLVALGEDNAGGEQDDDGEPAHGRHRAALRREQPKDEPADATDDQPDHDQDSGAHAARVVQHVVTSADPTPGHADPGLVEVGKHVADPSDGTPANEAGAWSPGRRRCRAPAGPPRGRRRARAAARRHAHGPAGAAGAARARRRAPPEDDPGCRTGRGRGRGFRAPTGCPAPGRAALRPHAGPPAAVRGQRGPGEEHGVEVDRLVRPTDGVRLDERRDRNRVSPETSRRSWTAAARVRAGSPRLAPRAITTGTSRSRRTWTSTSEKWCGMGALGFVDGHLDRGDAVARQRVLGDAFGERLNQVV